jgi:hypothetical protein
LVGALAEAMEGKVEVEAARVVVAAVGEGAA